MAIDPKATPQPNAPAKKPEWAPRIWQGSDFFGWLRLLGNNRFAVGLRYWYIAVIAMVVTLFHTAFRFLQEILYGQEVRRTEITEPPIFIIGHWRTGTTLLHELLVLDPAHSYPNTYQCLSPNHILLSEEFMKKMFSGLMPSRRPMDNMKAGWERPQEDEFALCLLGVPSPYHTIAFPNHPPQNQEFYDLEDVSKAERKQWKAAFLRFIQQLTLKTGKRLVLKSPPHTCRIKVLQELFPKAVFIHIVRDPYVVFPSTVNLWKSLYRTHGLQKPTFEGLEDLVFETGLRMYNKLEETRSLVHPSRFYEIRYEDLVAHPLREVQRLYKHLELGDFETMRPSLENYLNGVSGYKTNKYTLTPEQEAEIAERWGSIIERYGYQRHRQEQSRWAS